MIDRFQAGEALRRYREREQQRARNLRLIGEHRYLQVDSPDRVEKFLRRRGLSSRDAAEFMRRREPGLPPEVSAAGEAVRLERVLGVSDLMGVAFLECGLRVARTVGRVWIGVSSGRPEGFGTGFMVSPRLLLTNHHVLGDVATARKSLVEFNFQLSADGSPLATTSFGFAPEDFFVADRALDYALVAVQGTSANGHALRDFGWNTLSDEEGKAIAAQWLNIIQHPNGEPKQLALRANQVIDVLENFLHYQTDTAPGSSGSPAFNDRWEVVALHHSGVWATNAAGQILTVDGQVWRDDMGEDRIKWIANEGVRISRILAHVRGRQLTDSQRRLLDELAAPNELFVRSDSRPSDSGPLSRTPTATVAADGTATWTIPLTVSVNIGGTAIRSEPVLPSIPTTAAPTASTAAAATDASHVTPEAILLAAKRELGTRADVLNVRLGYVFKDGWITKERAVVVTVRQKAAPAALREAAIDALPATFRGLPVEVTNPTIEELVTATRGPAVAEAAFREEALTPEEIKYFPPPGAALEPVTAQMRVIAHASPDVGWPQLKAFLAATKKQLIVGMYDFGAPHIADAVESAGRKAGFQKMVLVMQHGEDVGSGTKADDLTDDQVVEKLEGALGAKFENAWVTMGRVNGWISSSYHIKVAVRDGQAFWLSSGNWQSSNQPDVEPLNDHPAKRDALSRFNREWHAIVEHPGLAGTFRTYLLHDFEENKKFVPGPELTLPDLLVPDAFFIPAPNERAQPIQYFAPFDDTRVFSVQPILTPDNYIEHVLQLIESAENEILIQNQTFNPANGDQEKLQELLQAILTKQQAGVEVRIIFRVLFASKAREVLTGLQDFGFDPRSIKVQKNCHTKGIVVDRKRVLLGSQNISSDGITMNRDASLLFDDEPLAVYFRTLFEHDWLNLAKQDIGSEAMPIEVASAADPTPKGMVRLTWKDYLEML